MCERFFGCLTISSLPRPSSTRPSTPKIKKKSYGDEHELKVYVRHHGVVELASRKYCLIADAPVVKPLQVLVLLVASSHTPTDGDEQDVKSNNDSVQGAIDDALHDSIAVPQNPVDKETQGEDGKVQSRIIVVNVGDTRHDDKGKVVQEPADDGVDAGVVDLINLKVAELLEPALPSHNVPCHNSGDKAERGGGDPVDERVAKKEVLDNVVIPAAHAKADVQDGPLPPLRGQVILLVGIRHQGVVGSHHCDIEVNEIVDEGRLVNTGVAGRH